MLRATKPAQMTTFPARSNERAATQSRRFYIYICIVMSKRRLKAARREFVEYSCSAVRFAAIELFHFRVVMRILCARELISVYVEMSEIY